MAGPSNDLVAAVRASAGRLGVDPSDLLTIMSYETGGTLNHNRWGGKNNNHLGLIQFGTEERAKYGVRPGMAVADQVQSAENYLRDRGVKPGMQLLDLYSTVNAGRPGLYGRSDERNGGAPGTVADKVASMAAHRMRANALLGLDPSAAGPGGAPASPAASAAAPGGTPLSLAPAGLSGVDAADPALTEAIAGLAAIPAQQDAALPAAAPAATGLPAMKLGQIQSWAPPIKYASPPGLAKARALAHAMSRSTLG